MSAEAIVDKELNLQGEVCPYTFVHPMLEVDPETLVVLRVGARGVRQVREHDRTPRASPGWPTHRTGRPRVPEAIVGVGQVEVRGGDDHQWRVVTKLQDLACGTHR